MRQIVEKDARLVDTRSHAAEPFLRFDPCSLLRAIELRDVDAGQRHRGDCDRGYGRRRIGARQVVRRRPGSLERAVERGERSICEREALHFSVEPGLVESIKGEAPGEARAAGVGDERARPVEWATGVESADRIVTGEERARSEWIVTVEERCAAEPLQ